MKIKRKSRPNPKRSRATVRQASKLGAMVVVMLLIVSKTSNRVHAADGVLDTTFGSSLTGKVTTDFFGTSDEGFAVATDALGRIVVAGSAISSVTKRDFALARYTSKGILDMDFGPSFTGKVTTDFFGDFDQAQAIVIDSVGRIVVAGIAFNGTANFDFALARYTSAGVLDTTFGPTLTGKVTTDFFGAADLALALAIDSSERIVLAGFARTGTDTDFALARYTSTGFPDITFNPIMAGKITTDLFGGLDEGHAVAIDSSGRIVVAGVFILGTPNFALARYTSTGLLDTTFGPTFTGKVVTDFGGGAAAAAAIAFQGDGIIASGFATTGTGIDFALARYTASGLLDTTFGPSFTGKVTTDFSGSQDDARAIALDGGGRIVAAGFATIGTNADFALARYSGSGILDKTFGPSLSGKVTTDFFGGNDIGRAVAVQTDGKIVVAGQADTSTVDDFAVARYANLEVGPFPPNSVPTLSQWGTIILSLLLLIAGMTFILRRRPLIAGATTGGVDQLPELVNTPLLVPRVFGKALAGTLSLVLVGLAVVAWLSGPVGPLDIGGTLLCALMFAYLVHLFILAAKASHMKRG